jgi:glucosylglycerate synthase
VEPDSIPGETLEQIERIGSTDLVVGVLRSDPEGAEDGAARLVREAVGRLSSGARAVVIHNNGTAPSAPRASSSPVEEGPVRVLGWKLADPEPAGAPQQNLSDAYRAIFRVGGKLGARACGVIASDLRGVTPQWILRLVEPALEKGFDLVTPCYSAHKFEGLLNKSIVAPLNRSLYGARIQNPMGPDFGLSGKLLQQISEQEPRSLALQAVSPVSAITPTALAAGMQICEANVGVRLLPPTDPKDLSSLLAQVMGPVFLDMERNAAVWQRVRGSHAVPRFGDPVPPPAESGTADLRRMLESFQIGAQNLQDVWGLVLPPKTMLETVRLARLPPAQFRMPDELWVSIVYDFALAHRLRTISRDHLLRSLTPLYLGWVVSYALEMETASPEAVESRLERLSKAFEAGKSYLMSRWRWPDRFNP